MAFVFLYLKFGRLPNYIFRLLCIWFKSKMYLFLLEKRKIIFIFSIIWNDSFLKNQKKESSNICNIPKDMFPKAFNIIFLYMMHACIQWWILFRWVFISFTLSCCYWSSTVLSINKFENSDSVGLVTHTNVLVGDIEVNRKLYKTIFFSEKCKCDCLNKL